MGLFGSLFRKDEAPQKTHKLKVEVTMAFPSVSLNWSRQINWRSDG